MYAITEMPDFEGLKHTQTNTALYIGRGEQCEGLGTLYVDESELVWWSAAGNKGWALPYPSIMCHATCRDTTSEGAFPHPCIYCHLDAGDDDEFGPNGDDDDSSVEEPVTEVRFVPEDSDVLDAIFGAMTECQALHPDDTMEEFEEDEYDGEDAEEGMFFTADNLAELEAHLANNPEAAARFALLESGLAMPSEEQFEALVREDRSDRADADKYDDAD